MKQESVIKTNTSVLEGGNPLGIEKVLNLDKVMAGILRQMKLCGLQFRMADSSAASLIANDGKGPAFYEYVGHGISVADEARYLLVVKAEFKGSEVIKADVLPAKFTRKDAFVLSADGGWKNSPALGKVHSLLEQGGDEAVLVREACTAAGTHPYLADPASLLGFLGNCAPLIRLNIMMRGVSGVHFRKSGPAQQAKGALARIQGYAVLAPADNFLKSCEVVYLNGKYHAFLDMDTVRGRKGKNIIPVFSEPLAGKTAESLQYFWGDCPPGGTAFVFPLSGKAYAEARSLHPYDRIPAEALHMHTMGGTRELTTEEEGVLSKIKKAI